MGFLTCQVTPKCCGPRRSCTAWLSGLALGAGGKRVQNWQRDGAWWLSVANKLPLQQQHWMNTGCLQCDTLFLWFNSTPANNQITVCHNSFAQRPPFIEYSGTVSFSRWILQQLSQEDGQVFYLQRDWKIPSIFFLLLSALFRYYYSDLFDSAVSAREKEPSVDLLAVTAKEVGGETSSTQYRSLRTLFNCALGVAIAKAPETSNAATICLWVDTVRYHFHLLHGCFNDSIK